MIEPAYDNGQSLSDGPPPVIPRGPDDSQPDIDLMEYVGLVWSHRWMVLIVLAVTVAISATWAFTQPKRYRSSIKIAIDSTPGIATKSIFGTNWWEMERYILDQVQVLKTEMLAQRVVDRLGLDTHPEWGGPTSARALVGSLEVEQVQETDIIELSLTGLDPEDVAELLNVFVDEYIAAQIEAGFERSKQVFEVIQQRIDPLQQRLAASEQKLMEFQEREDALLFADQDKNVISEQVSTLTTEYARAKAERIRLETKINALNRLRTTNLAQASFPEVLQDSTIQSLSQQRNDLEVELDENLRTYKEGHPVIKEMRSRIASINEQISEQIDTIRTSLRTDFDIARRREQSLFSNIQQLKQQSIELSKQTMEYDRLKREYEQNKRFLEDMLARSKEIDPRQDAMVNNVRVIDPARPARGPYSPNIRQTIVFSVFIGLFLGIGLVLGLDFLDQTFRTPEHIERYLGLEVLAALPTFTEERARVLRESFQSLRTALMLAARGEAGQTLMVTSAAPAEGKTTVAFNLGKVLATGGSRVLLIDADLRKPRLHRLLKTRNTKGLTSVVLGENDISEVIHGMADLPSLDFITTGPLPPNPPELYGKPTFRQLLDNARQSYDWVIIDTPPVASVTDPVICSRLVDMATLVVEYGGTKRKIVQEAVRQLSRTGVRLVGTLLNKVDVERDQYYYSYYTYYSYGYGEEPKEPSKVDSLHTSSASKRS
jgi:capsular exopolysaccharide synthesis family protein